MFGKSLALVSAVTLAPILATVPTAARACVLDNANPATTQTATDSYGDRNRGGPYGFYSYPRHRSVDGRGAIASRPFSPLSTGTSPYDNSHGSAYYGPNYGAPYFGGGYYDEGTYYRERRD